MTHEVSGIQRAKGLVRALRHPEEYDREFAPPGHYYSPIPDRAALAASGHWSQIPTTLPGIDLRTEAQVDWLRRIAPLARPDWERPDPSRRYAYQNDFFSYGDALALHGMIALERPRRIIEVGSGFSTAVMLDTLDHLGAGEASVTTSITCIEPYPDRLRALLRPADHIEILTQPVQHVPVATFEALAAGDILFIDSSHVSKCGSDVNFLFFEILPRLAAGVRVHVHDVFYPFEYPREWVVDEHRSFNEDYLLRAFLIGNVSYRIELWLNYVASVTPEEIRATLPLAERNIGGSIWLQRV
jgi:predicted O-methyltransferase YrrM